MILLFTSVLCFRLPGQSGALRSSGFRCSRQQSLLTGAEAALHHSLVRGRPGDTDPSLPVSDAGRRRCRLEENKRGTRETVVLEV